jgi:hypothetical protein
MGELVFFSVALMSSVVSGRPLFLKPDTHCWMFNQGTRVNDVDGGSEIFFHCFFGSYHDRQMGWGVVVGLLAGQ